MITCIYVTDGTCRKPRRFNGSGEAGFSLALVLANYTVVMYNQDMKKRTNMYFDESDRALLALIKQHYNLASDAAAVRLAIKRVAEEIERDVPGQKGAHRQDGTTR